MKTIKISGTMTLMLLAMLINVTAALGQSRKERKQARKFFETNLYSGSPADKDFKEKITFTNIYGWIVLPVTVKGQVYHFVFDTGAPTIISEDIVKALGLKPIAHISMEDAAGKNVAQNVYRLDSLRLGAVTFLNEGCVGSDLASLSEVSCTNIDGIIGANLMRDCIWTIDYSDSSVTFSNQPPLFSKNDKTVSFKENVAGAMPIAPLTIGDTTILATIDYGDNGLSSVPEAIFQKTGTVPPPMVCGNGVAMVTLNQKLSSANCRAYIENFKLENETFTHQLFDIVPANEISLIGAAFLSHYKVTLDWKKHKLHFDDCRNRSPQKSYYTESFGIGIGWENGKTIVSFLWDNSEAAKQGIVVGEEVVAVNGYKNLNNHDNFCDLQNDLYNHENIKELRITLKDKNQNTKTYVLNKRSLFGD